MTNLASAVDNSADKLKKIAEKLSESPEIKAIYAKTDEKNPILKIVCGEANAKLMEFIRLRCGNIAFELVLEKNSKELGKEHEILYEKKLVPYELISYSLIGLQNVTKIQVCRRVKGYASKKKINGQVKEYSYPGLKNDEGVILVSDSTVMIPAGDLATGFEDFLSRKLVTYTKRRVWM